MRTTGLEGWTVVFDLDGTLVDTAPDLHAALNYSLDRAGYQTVPFDSIRDMIGQGAKAMIRKGIAFQDGSISDEELEPLWEEFLAYYRDHISDHSASFPGMLETLDFIDQEGGISCVCTNKTQALAEELLSSLGLTDRFTAIVGADAVPNKKPDGDHIVRTIAAAKGETLRSIMIGDSQTDERAAWNARLPFVFVSFGYGPVPDRTDAEILWADTYAEVTAHIQAITKA